MNNLKQIVVIKLDYHTASDFAGCKDFGAKKMVKTLDGGRQFPELCQSVANCGSTKSWSMTLPLKYRMEL